MYCSFVFLETIFFVVVFFVTASITCMLHHLKFHKMLTEIVKLIPSRLFAVWCRISFVFFVKMYLLGLF